MEKVKILLFIFLTIFLINNTVQADLYIQQTTNTSTLNVTELKVDIIPNSYANYNFSLCVKNNNESIIRLYYFGVLNTTISNTTIYNLTLPYNQTINGTNMTDGCAVIFLNTTIANKTLANSYPEKIVFMTLSNTTELPINITVWKTTFWSINQKNINISTNVSLFSQQNISITNEGNVKLIFNVNKTDPYNVGYFDISSFELMPNTSIIRPLYFFLNPEYCNTSFVNISFTDNADVSKSFYLNYSIVDITPPTFENLIMNPSQVEIGQQTVILADVSDNVGVKYMTLEYEGKKINFSTYNSTKYQFIFNDTIQSRVVNMTVTAFDKVNNNISTVIRLLVRPKYSMESVNALNFGKMKFRTERVLNFFNIQSPINISLRIRRLTITNPNSTITLKINNREILQNETLFMENALGQYKIVINEPQRIVSYYDNNSNLIQYPDNSISSYLTDFSGEIEISTQSNYENPTPIVYFNGIYSTYSVALPIKYPIPVIVNGQLSSTNLSCTPYDTGDYLTSNYACTSNYPIDSVESSIQAVTTLDAYNNLVASKDANITFTSRERDDARFQEYFLLLILIIIIVVFLVYIFIFKNGLWM